MVARMNEGIKGAKLSAGNSQATRWTVMTIVLYNYLLSLLQAYSS